MVTPAGPPAGRSLAPTPDAVPNLTHLPRPLLAAMAACACTSLTVATAADAAAGKRGGRPAADLVVRDLETEVSDFSVDLDLAVANLGNKRATSSTLVVALSDDDILDDDDEILEEVGVRRVKGKQRRDVSTTVDLPEDLDVDSEVELLVCADGYDEVRERKESNNCEVVTVDLSGDDLGDDFGDDSDPADVVEPGESDQ